MSALVSVQLGAAEWKAVQVLLAVEESCHSVLGVVLGVALGAGQGACQ